MALTIPSDRTQNLLRWGVCFAVVLAVHAVAVVKLLEQSDFADVPPGTEVVQLNLAVGDPQEQIDPVPYTPPKPVEKEVKPQEEPEQKEAEITLPKEEKQLEPPTPVEPTPLQEEQQAKAPPMVSPEVVHKWQMTVNTRLNQFKRYPPQARARHHEGRVVVAFTLDTEGHVISSKIMKSSGSPILDQETLDLISRAQPYPVPPDGAGGQDLFLQVPITYGLR